MLSVLGWMIQHWWLVLALGAVLGAYIVGGWRLALAVATLGAGAGLYSKGQEAERARQRQRAERARQDRERVEQGVGAMGIEDVERELGKWNRD